MERRDIINIFSFIGVLTTVYANSNLSLPAEMHVKGWAGAIKKYYFLTNIGLLLTTVSLMSALALGTMKRPSLRTMAPPLRATKRKREDGRQGTKSEEGGPEAPARSGTEEHRSALISRLECINSTLLVLSMPVEAVVVTLYWTLYFINPVLVVNRELYLKGIQTSLFANLCMHLFPLFFLLLEFFYTRIDSSPSHLVLLGAFNIVYVALLHVHYKTLDKWPYGVIGELEGFKKYLLFLGTYLCLCFYYHLGMVAHRRIHKRPKYNRKPSDTDLHLAISERIAVET